MAIRINQRVEFVCIAKYSCVSPPKLYYGKVSPLKVDTQESAFITAFCS